MRLKLIACGVLQREFALLAAKSTNIIDMTTIRQQYHETPTQLTQLLQEEIDRIDANTDPHTNDLSGHGLDAIVLGYGLCSNAIVGLRSKKYRLVIPRAHDCATLVMGSKETYQTYFETWKGSYFFTRGWYELGSASVNDGQRVSRLRQYYMEKYGDEDVVEELLELESEMTAHYQYITYVLWPGLSDEASIQCARESCAQRGWQFNLMTGSSCLLEDLLEGRWDPEKFLVLEPGQCAAASWDSRIIRPAQA